VKNCAAYDHRGMKSVDRVYQEVRAIKLCLLAALALGSATAADYFGFIHVRTDVLLILRFIRDTTSMEPEEKIVARSFVEASFYLDVDKIEELSSSAYFARVDKQMREDATLMTLLSIFGINAGPISTHSPDISIDVVNSEIYTDPTRADLEIVRVEARVKFGLIRQTGWADVYLQHYANGWKVWALSDADLATNPPITPKPPEPLSQQLSGAD
jgi:hypothetical protein